MAGGLHLGCSLVKESGEIVVYRRSSYAAAEPYRLTRDADIGSCQFA